MYAANHLPEWALWKLELPASSYTQIQQLLYAANYFPELGLLKLELSQLHHIHAPSIYTTRPFLSLLHLKLHTKLLPSSYICFFGVFGLQHHQSVPFFVILNFGLIGPLKLSDKPQLSSSCCFGKLAKSTNANPHFLQVKSKSFSWWFGAIDSSCGVLNQFAFEMLLNLVKEWHKWFVRKSMLAS